MGCILPPKEILIMGLKMRSNCEINHEVDYDVALSCYGRWNSMLQYIRHAGLAIQAVCH